MSDEIEFTVKYMAGRNNPYRVSGKFSYGEVSARVSAKNEEEALELGKEILIDADAKRYNAPAMTMGRTSRTKYEE